MQRCIEVDGEGDEEGETEETGCPESVTYSDGKTRSWRERSCGQ